MGSTCNEPWRQIPTLPEIARASLVRHADGSGRLRLELGGEHGDGMHSDDRSRSEGPARMDQAIRTNRKRGEAETGSQTAGRW